MTMPALALVGASGCILYSTEPFRTRCERSGSLCEELPELEAVLSGGVDRAVVSLGAFETHVEVVGDAGGNRCALLTLAIEPEQAQDGENPILREPLDESPAIVWLKDLEGRHIRVNRQFLAVLGGSEDQLIGRTDAELPPAATVDGPRLGDGGQSASEPVEFGYAVPAYADRQALSVVRFLVQSADGEPVAVCGVAAPMAHSEIAEDEAARLMRLNSWSHNDSASMRADVLEEWGVRFDAPSPDGADDADEGIASAREEADAAEAQAEAARAELESAQAEVEAARAELASARAEAASARLEAESTRVELGGVQAEIAAAGREADAARAEAATAWTEAETERTNAGLLASQLADARRQLQHQRAQTALAQQQLQIPRCSAAAQASRPASQNGRRIEAAQIALRARKPAVQPLDPTLMSQPAPVPVGAHGAHREDMQRGGGLLGRLRPRGRR